MQKNIIYIYNPTGRGDKYRNPKAITEKGVYLYRQTHARTPHMRTRIGKDAINKGDRYQIYKNICNRNTDRILIFHGKEGDL